MAKSFARRVSKKQRKSVDLSDRIDSDVFKLSDDRLLQGARLLEIKLKDIRVKDQVRTKFNDSSIRELAANIEANGLIQPLVVHRNGIDNYTLICGERRYRAMTSIEMKHAPCFVLENKTEQELMAIQFSENSAREALHYIDKADGILNYQKATRASERKIQAALGISKSEVHRSLMIAKMPTRIKEAAKVHNIEKYVLLEWDALEVGEIKKMVEKKILKGEIVKRSQLKTLLRSGKTVSTSKKTKKRVVRKKSPALPRGLSANAFLKAMDANAKDLDPEGQKALKELLEKTKDMMGE